MIETSTIAFDNASTVDYRNSPCILVAYAKDGSKDIRIHNLTVKTPGYNSVTLVENVSMTLKAGSRTALTGASGSGKTLTAKALLNQHDPGSGLIVMPDGTKIMSMPQRIYFPSVNLRGIMNAKPSGKEIFRDLALSEALSSVGLDRLTQQIPGQKTGMILDSLSKDLSQLLSEQTSQSADELIKHITGIFTERAKQQVVLQFDSIQSIPEKQRKRFTYELESVFNTHRRWDISETAIDELSQAVITAMETQLVAPLIKTLTASTIAEMQNGLGSFIPRGRAALIGFLELIGSHILEPIVGRYSDKASIKKAVETVKNLIHPLHSRLSANPEAVVYKGWGQFIPFTEDKIKYLQWNFNRIIGKKLKSYLNNQDTDDAEREIRISPEQAVYIQQQINKSLGENLHTRKAKGVATGVLSRLTWPISLKTLHGKAARMARYDIQHLTHEAENQILQGDRMTLSGGQRKMLALAMLKLHNPDILFLDEITSGLDPDSAVELYQDLLKSIPATTTVLSIVHDPHIIPLHTDRAHLANKTITLRKIEPEKLESPGLTI